MAVKPRLVVNIRERDLGMGHFLREAAKIRKKPFVKVGVTQAKGSKLHVDERTGESVKTVADIMQIHEYGAVVQGKGGAEIVIPERSVIRSTVDRNQAKYDARIAKLRDQIFDANANMTTERALGLIGQEVSSDMKNTIRNNEAGLNGPTPLVSRVGTPLLDTGQTVNSLSYEVVMGGEEGAATPHGGHG